MGVCLPGRHDHGVLGAILLVQAMAIGTMGTTPIKPRMSVSTVPTPGLFDMYGNAGNDFRLAFVLQRWFCDDPEGPYGLDRVSRGGYGTVRRGLVRPVARPQPATALTTEASVSVFSRSADVASPEMQIFGDVNITHLQDTAQTSGWKHDVRDGNIDNITVSGTLM